MLAIRRSIAHARLRLVLQEWVTWLGRSALAGLAVATLLLLGDRLLGWSVPWWSYLAIAGAVAVAASAVAVLLRPSIHRAATLIDERLHLKDRFGTALYARSLADDPFVRRVLEDAEQTAAATKVSQAFPVRPGTVWAWVVPVAAVTTAVALFLPGGFDLLGREARDQQQQQSAEAAEIAEQQIVEARALIEQASSESDLVEADPTQIMKELASLTQRDLTNPELRRKTAAELSEVQDRLAQTQEAKQQEFRSLQNQMSRLDAGTHGPADRFADALRRGDFQAAQQELGRLAEQLARGDYSESDRKLLQQQLESLSDQLQQMADNAAAQQQQVQRAINEQLEQAGLNQQQIQQLQQQGYNPQAVQQALSQAYQQQGMNQQQAQQQAGQQAQQIQQQHQQAQQQQNQQQAQSGMSSGLSQMASAMGQQPSQQPGQQSGQQPGQQGQQPGQQSQQAQAGQQPGQQPGGAQFQQGAWQTQQQLGQMAQMQQQLQRMGHAQSQLRQAMQQMQHSPAGQGQQARQGGRGGQKAGTGAGGHPLGPTPQQMGPYQTHASGDVQDRQGRVIASWMERGQAVAGEATVDFEQTVTSARDDADRAVTEDRVPRRYHQAIKGYFNQLPETAEELRRTAPAAPR